MTVQAYASDSLHSLMPHSIYVVDLPLSCLNCVSSLSSSPISSLNRMLDNNRGVNIVGIDELCIFVGICVAVVPQSIMSSASHTCLSMLVSRIHTI